MNSHHPNKNHQKTDHNVSTSGTVRASSGCKSEFYIQLGRVSIQLGSPYKRYGNVSQLWRCVEDRFDLGRIKQIKHCKDQTNIILIHLILKYYKLIHKKISWVYF